MREVTRLHPSALNVSVNINPLSTATMTLPEGEPMVGIRAFVELYAGEKSLGVYQVTQTGTNYGTEQTVTLEHAITTLDDSVTAADSDLKGSMQTIMQTIIDTQDVKRWKLGRVEATGEEYELAVNYTQGLQALLDALALVDGYYLSFDQSEYPWTVSLLKQPEDAACECRISRNAESVTVTLDTSTLCTRVYNSLLDGGHMDADTISKWGVVAQSISLDEPAEGEEETTNQKNRETARKYLEKNKNPSVSISISALRLAELTGEKMDDFRIGQVCQVALPDWGVEMRERIISMQYGDLVSDPDRVQLTLSTAEKTAGSTLAAMNNRVQQTTKIVKEQHKHITETDMELKLHADKISANGREISLKASQAEVDLFSQRLYTAEINLDGLKGTIELKASKDDIISTINMSPESIKIKSALIELDGAVVAKSLKGNNIDVSLVDAANVQTQDLSTSLININGQDMYPDSLQVVTGLDGAWTTTEDVQYTDWNGNKKTVTVVKAVGLNVPKRATINYLGYNE